MVTLLQKNFTAIQPILPVKEFLKSVNIWRRYRIIEVWCGAAENFLVGAQVYGVLTPFYRAILRAKSAVITGWNTSKIISRPNSLRAMVQREHPQN